MNLPDSSILTNIHFPGNAKPGNLLFEKKYITIRCIENRLYTDEEVMKLPAINPAHTHYREWMMRKKSSRRFINYLSVKQKRLSILEIGCGNGWLAHSLSAIPGAEVTGLDINFTELQQAARVFNEDPHLRFIYGDIHAGILHDLKFDIIVFAASIQYFRSLRKTLAVCMQHLAPGGEIHITDTHFYKPAEIHEAKKRTADYYSSLGYPEMAEYYFHHLISELQAFDHKILFNPVSVKNRILRNTDPFYWIRIQKD
jgi:ubiquinone/menaquinone biosynthesis C-methylase UbiE